MIIDINNKGDHKNKYKTEREKIDSNSTY